MAFETIVTPGMHASRTPYVKFKWGLSGVRGYLSAQVRTGANRIFIEIDKETKQIRIKGAPDGARGDSLSMGGGRSRGFAMSKAAMIEMDNEDRIPLTQSVDGWWYGTYKKGG